MSTEINNSNKKFEDALHLLNEAAREKKHEIQSILGNKYSHIREVIQESASDRIADFNRLKKQAQVVIEQGSEKAKEAVTDLDKKVHQNPWPYIGGAAVGALLLGYLLGSSKRQ